MVSQKHYDYIITGGGCAGLSLVYHMLQTELKHKKILIIEKERKKWNDRTWCFWEKRANPFEKLVFHRWRHMYFYSDSFTKKLDLSPYEYKMIRSIDFYQHVDQEISLHQNVIRLQAAVEDVRDHNNEVEVLAGGKIYKGKWVFNSIRLDNEARLAGDHHYLLQHFKGWVVKTDQPFFNPEEAILMDFRVGQHDDCRFVYVLPTDAHTALVEYTVFSGKLLSHSDYDAALQHYMERFLALRDYTIEHEEFGVIPMTDMPYARQQGERIVNMGTAGGVTKPSTGYTFLRIQQDTRALVQNMLVEGKPVRKQIKWQKRFALYDGALLHVLAQRLYPADGVFAHLFKNNPTERVFKFLDEETSLWEEVKVANSVPRLAFMRGMWYASFH